MNIENIDLSRIVERTYEELEKECMRRNIDKEDSEYIDHLLEAIVSKLALVDQLEMMGEDFERLENLVYRGKTTYINEVMNSFETGNDDITAILKEFLMEARHFSYKIYQFLN